MKTEPLLRFGRSRFIHRHWEWIPLGVLTPNKGLHVTRNYRLYSANTATADAVASVKITHRGVLASISFCIYGLAGAAVDGYTAYELSKQSVSSFTQNDTPPTTLHLTAIARPITSAAFAQQYNIVGLAQPVDVGDTIYLHLQNGGTAPTTIRASAVLAVNE